MRNNLHILILSSWYPTEEHPFLGNFVQRHAALLATQYEVTVVHTEVGHDYSIELNEVQGYKEIRSRHPKGGTIISRKRNQQKALEQALNQLTEVDLIIGHVLLNKGWQFVHAKKKLGCPLLYVEHGSYFKTKSSKWSIKERLIFSKVLPEVDEVIAVSDFLQASMTNSIYRPIEVIGNHVDESLFDVKPKKHEGITEFLHVSTLDPKTKNPEGLLKAFSLLKESSNDFRLTVICDEDTTHWKNRAEELQLNDRIRFIGPLEWKEVVPYYHEAHAFVLFSEYESFSIVLAEAFLTGTPVISTSVGIANNLSPDLGIQVQQKDPEDLAAALLAFTRDALSFNQSTLRSFGEQFSTQNILNAWNQLIEKHVD